MSNEIETIPFFNGTLIEDLIPQHQEAVFYVIEKSASLTFLFDMIRNRHNRDHRFAVKLRDAYLDIEREAPVKLTQAQINHVALIAKRFEAEYYNYPNINLMFDVPEGIKEQFGHLTGDVEKLEETD